LVTDFNLLTAGALHRANGGYLVLDAQKLVTGNFGWASLKRALDSSQIRIETLEQLLSMASTVSLAPQPIPLGVKVVLVGGVENVDVGLSVPPGTGSTERNLAVVGL